MPRLKESEFCCVRERIYSLVPPQVTKLGKRIDGFYYLAGELMRQGPFNIRMVKACGLPPNTKNLLEFLGTDTSSDMRVIVGISNRDSFGSKPKKSMQAGFDISWVVPNRLGFTGVDILLKEHFSVHGQSISFNVARNVNNPRRTKLLETYERNMVLSILDLDIANKAMTSYHLDLLFELMDILLSQVHG